MTNQTLQVTKTTAALGSDTAPATEYGLHIQGKICSYMTRPSVRMKVTCLTRSIERLGLFDRIIALEHPRYVMQYKARSLEVYIDKYLHALNEVR
jgi:hypothetical protein